MPPSKEKQRMKRLIHPTLLALAATGCMHSRAALIDPSREADKCEMIQTLMREPVPRQFLSQLMARRGDDRPSQVLVFVFRPEQALLERLFAGTPKCGDTHYKVVQDITKKGLVLFLQPEASGYSFDAQLSVPNELSLGSGAKGTLTRRDDRGWVASSF
jgi:hypothetical protein